MNETSEKAKSMEKPADWLEVDSGWYRGLSPLFREPWWNDLRSFVEEERARFDVYPPPQHVFQAYRLTPLEQVKFVILGQDPYHGAGQAHGLSFSVPKGIRTPPSLANIFRELNADLGEEIPASGNLSAWARRGGLLLNTVLTVRAAEANSHRKQGWEKFTDATIRLVNQECENVAFVLWGAPARKKSSLIDGQRHLIIESPHPSPLSAYRGFLGSRPFSKINRYRRCHGLAEIAWSEVKADECGDQQNTR